MIELYNDKIDCTGCGACYHVCPENCIEMTFDSEGFRYPVIDAEKCISCNQCVQVCPIRNGKETNNFDKPIFYSAISRDMDSLKKSSSGGVFSLLAADMIKAGGVVYGCAFDKNNVARHVCIDKMEEMDSLRGSKYVQSDMGDCYKRVKRQLDNQERVLFSGTPCQVAGLKRFLGADYDRLLLVDVLCHGVPSPILFQKHIERLKRRHQGEIRNYKFRSKSKYGWGSENRTYYEVEKKGRIKSYTPWFPEYFTAFFYGISLRPSCYQCRYSRPKREGDITLADFWGYWSKYKKTFPQGISVVGINNVKGQRVFCSIQSQMEIEPLAFEEATKSNYHFFEPAGKCEVRDRFYSDINQYGYRHIYKKVYIEHRDKKAILRTFYGRFMPRTVRFAVRRGIEALLRK